MIIPEDRSRIICLAVTFIFFNSLPPPEYGQTMEEVIDSETDGDFALALHGMLKANKNEGHIVDLALAKKDARVCHLMFLMLSYYFYFFRSDIMICFVFVLQELFEAGEEHKDIDISVFIDILTTRSGPQLTQSKHCFNMVMVLDECRGVAR